MDLDINKFVPKQDNETNSIVFYLALLSAIAFSFVLKEYYSWFATVLITISLLIVFFPLRHLSLYFSLESLKGNFFSQLDGAEDEISQIEKNIENAALNPKELIDLSLGFELLRIDLVERKNYLNGISQGFSWIFLIVFSLYSIITLKLTELRELIIQNCPFADELFSLLLLLLSFIFVTNYILWQKVLDESSRINKFLIVSEKYE